MEKRTGNNMVTEQLKYVSINIREIIENDYRLEASVYNFKTRLAKDILKKCKYPLTTICGKNGLATSFVVGRYKRNYINKNIKGAVGFLGSSEMLELHPNPIKYIIPDKKYTNFKVEKDWILLSCSGTVGNPVYISNTLKNYIFSQHSLRIIDKKFPGYLYAFLSTDLGHTLITSNNYGAVIQHIEPVHLERVPIPNPPDKIKQLIHDLIIQSFDLRDQYNELLKKAEEILYDELNLLPIENIKPKYFDETVDLKSYSVPLSELDLRFDASYHLPIITEIIKILKQNAMETKTLGNLGNAITMPGIFKRNYVEKVNGVAFLGTNDILQLSPKIEKYLSIVTHKKLIEKHLSVKENTLLITDRGTIGNVILVPKYYETENWVVSQNAIRVISDKKIIGYIFVFLNSEIGKTLIKRETYGAVIDMIDPENASNIIIPLLKNKEKQKEINDLALQANEIRTNAFYKEKEAIEILNLKVLYNE